MLFRQAHNAAPTCSPSRAALLTGMCPHSAGQFGLVNRGFDLRDPSRHLVHTLRAAGYRSTLAGVQHVRRDPRTIGYDEILNTATTKARVVAPAAAEFLAAAPRQPFFLTVGFSETHRAFPPPAPADDARYVRPPAPFPDTPETRADMAAYQACLTALDHGIGMVLGALDEAGLADEHAGDLHHRPRPAVPAHEVQPDRPRHRRDADPARPRRLRRRPGERRAGVAHRPVSHPVRAAGDRAAGVAGGALAAAAGARRGGGGQRRGVRGGQLPRPVRAAAHDPHRSGGSTSAASPSAQFPRWPTATTASART